MISRGPIKVDTFQTLHEHGVPVATVLDVGVLTGTPELLAAYPGALHLLFEPVAEFAEAIGAAYAGASHRLVQAAVSDAEGDVELELSSIVAGVPISHSRMTGEGAGHRRVPMITLDGYLEREPAPGPYLLKIDIDGEELRVVAGAERVLAETTVVMIETPVHHITERLAALERRGFELFDLTEPCYYDGAFWQCDAVMLRRDVKASCFEPLGAAFDPAKYRPFTG